jgi:hypothetical protein
MQSSLLPILLQFQVVVPKQFYQTLGFCDFYKFKMIFLAGKWSDPVRRFLHKYTLIDLFFLSNPNRDHFKAYLKEGMRGNLFCVYTLRFPKSFDLYFELLHS